MNSIKDSVPAVYRCASLVCGGYNDEFMVLSLDYKSCPKCKKPGEWVKCFLGEKAGHYSCGICKRTIITTETEFPVGHYGWGFLQLSNRDPFQVICVTCTSKLRSDYPSLVKDVFNTKEEVLPKIIKPSKLAGAT